MPEQPGAPVLLDVVAAVIWREGRFLAVQRPEGKDFAGYWEFPGGKMEPFEKREAALGRELMEELGIRAEKFDFILEKSHPYPQFTVRLYFFAVSEFTGTPRPREGQTLRWVAPGEAEELDFLPADRPILGRLATPTT